MRIAFVTSTLSPAAGGLGTSVPATAAALDARDDVEVHVVGVADRGAPEAWRAWGRRVHAHRAYGPQAFAFAPALGRTLRDLAADVTDVQGLWVYPSLAHRRYQDRQARPYVVTPRGMLDPWALARSRWKKALVSRWFERRHLEGAACLRVTALMEARHVRALGLRQPLIVVPNGVDVPPLAAPIEPADGRRRLLFLSRLHPKKGLPFLLRAWAALQERHPDWELVIAGPDEVDHRAEMTRLAAGLGLERLRWQEPVEGAAKAALYRSADLFVLPTHAENFGLVVAEALAHGVPVVTTVHAPWEGLAVHGCGWWIDLTEPALCTALDDAMRLPAAERRAMGVRGRAWMQRDFAWSAVGQQLHEAYIWMLGGGPPPAHVLVD